MCERKWNLVAKAAGGARLGGYHRKPPKPNNAQSGRWLKKKPLGNLGSRREKILARILWGATGENLGKKQTRWGVGGRERRKVAFKHDP